MKTFVLNTRIPNAHLEMEKNHSQSSLTLASCSYPKRVRKSNFHSTNILKLSQTFG